jgi:hypothetical protein
MTKSLGMKVVRSLVYGALLSMPLSAPLQGQATAPEPLKLRVGDPAPDFKLQYFTGNDLKEVHLSDYRGKKNVILAFYIFAFTGG